MRNGAILDRPGRELRHAARRLLRSPAFTLATVLTLALAISANVAIFTVVQRVVLNPLPYGDSRRLLSLYNGAPVRNVSSGVNLSLQLYYQYLDRARTLDGLALYRVDERTLTGAGAPERVRVARTTPSLAPVLRTSPELGRWFTEEEGALGGSPVALISYGFWVRRYGHDSGVLGQRLTLDGVSTTVVGVMGPSFAFPDPRVDIWIPDPMSPTMATSPAVAGVFDYSAIARLRDGATLADARAELTRLTHDLASISPGNGYDQMNSTATTLIDAMVGGVARTLWILLAAVGLVLLVACANVANLFMVRCDAKQREVAVRRALGSGTGGIAGYFLAESAWLALAGGALGLALAWGAVRLLVVLGPTNLPRLHEVHIDGMTIAFTVALSFATGAACGVIPLLRLGPLTESLHESGRSNTASRTRHRARQVLMGGQVALALVLLVASGLMLRSFQKLRAIDPGFNPTSALTSESDCRQLTIQIVIAWSRRTVRFSNVCLSCLASRRSPRPRVYRFRLMGVSVVPCLWSGESFHLAPMRRSSGTQLSPAISLKRWERGSFADEALIDMTSSGTSRSLSWTRRSSRSRSPIRIQSANAYVWEIRRSAPPSVGSPSSASSPTRRRARLRSRHLCRRSTCR